MRTKFLTAILVGAALAVPATLFADVDFTRYVALGDSLTAGFQSGGLAVSGQQGSYPRWLHLEATGNDNFEQPLVSAPGIPAQLHLVSLLPVTIVPQSGLGNPLNLSLPRPYDNLGIPGARLHDTLYTVTDNGGLHDLILRGLGTAAQQALALQPTFVTLWIGNNDALAAATSGVVIEGVTITPTDQFETDYRALAAAIASSGAKVAVATIPRVTAIPFVSTIPPFVINPATNEPVLINGQTVPLIGPDGPLGPGDHVLLQEGQIELSQGIGIPAQLGGCGCPLSDFAVLSANETSEIQAHVDAYNSVIRSVASQNGWALVDTAAIFDDLVANGLSVGGIGLTTDFLTGGLFSYDGVHPTPFGYAYVAQQFIQAINSTYGAHIHGVNFRQALYGGAPATTAAVSSAAAAQASFSASAIASMDWALRIPTKDELAAILANGGGGVGGGGGHRHHRRHHPSQ